MPCLFCDQPIDRNNAWKGAADRFYCSEFCADSENSYTVERRMQKEVFDRQYLERLRRLLPFFRDLKSNRVGPLSGGALQ